MPLIPTPPPGSNALVGAGLRRGKIAWDRGRENPRLVDELCRRIKLDARVPIDVRDRLATAIKQGLAVDPVSQEALHALLVGTDSTAAQDALAERVRDLCRDTVEWSAGFSPDEFGKLAASVAQEAVSVVKATDREAAHVDHLVTRDAFRKELAEALRPSDAQGHEVGALLRGPLRQVDQEAAVHSAIDLEEAREPGPAAGLANGVADTLDAAGLEPAAVSFRLWAAQLWADAGERPRGQASLEGMAWKTMHSATHTAALSAIAQLRIIGAEEWLIRGLEAVESWARVPWAAKWLDDAIAQDDRADTVLRWKASRVLIASLLDHDDARVLTLTQDLGGLQSGARLDLSLDRLDALAAVEGPESSDEAWNELSDWVETEASVADQSKSWQRRGSALAARNDLEGARRAFRKAMRAWEQVGSSSAAVADAAFSLWRAESLLGDGAFDLGARGIAANMRAAGPLSHADSLLHSGDAHHLTGDLLRAHDSYWNSLALYYRAGDLDGSHLVRRRLADVYGASGRPEAMLEQAIIAGDKKRAATATSGINPGSLAQLPTQASAPWEREAAYGALIVLGGRARPELVAAWADRLLSDSESGPAASLVDHLPAVAMHALASVVLLIPENLQRAAFERLRAGIHNNRLVDAGRACAAGLRQAGILGLVDADAELVEMFLFSEGFDYLAATEIAQILSERAELRSHVSDLAVGANRQAVRALIWGVRDGEGDVSAWQSGAQSLAQEYIALEVHTETEVDGESRPSINMSARYEEGGHAAAYAGPDTCTALLAHLQPIVRDDDAPESVRASALRGCIPMLRVLSEDELTRVAVMAADFASGEYNHHPSESLEIDPLSNVQFAVDTDGHLQASALSAMGRIEQLSPKEHFREIVSIAESSLISAKPLVRAGGLEIVGRAIGSDIDIDLDQFLRDHSAPVRREALKVAKVRTVEELPRLLRATVEDEDYQVRSTVLQLAQSIADHEVIARIAERDPEAFLRAVAQRVVDEGRGGADPPEADQRKTHAQTDVGAQSLADDEERTT